MNKNRRIFSSMEDVKPVRLLKDVEKSRKVDMNQVVCKEHPDIGYVIEKENKE